MYALAFCVVDAKKLEEKKDVATPGGFVFIPSDNTTSASTSSFQLDKNTFNATISAKGTGFSFGLPQKHISSAPFMDVDMKAPQKDLVEANVATPTQERLVEYFKHRRGLNLSLIEYLETQSNLNDQDLRDGPWWTEYAKHLKDLVENKYKDVTAWLEQQQAQDAAMKP